MGARYPRLPDAREQGHRSPHAAVHHILLQLLGRGHFKGMLLNDGCRPISESQFTVNWRIQDFHLGGAQDIVSRSAHYERKVQSPLQPGCRAHLRALETLGF